MDEQKQIPLSIMLENAKGMMNEAFNEVLQQTHLPAFLMEGIVCDLLAEIRKQKNLELISDYNKTINKEREGEE